MGWMGNIIRQPDRLGLAALALVYIIWGSTYLAITEAVRGAGSMPPLLLGAVRMGLASAVLYSIAAFRGEKLSLGVTGAFRAAKSGLFLWLGGNGLVIVGLTRIDSGLAAVLMATTPLWLAVLVALRRRRLPTPRTGLGLALGLAGVIVLVGASRTGETAASLLGVALILAAALSWAVGSMMPSPSPSPLVSGAAIMWFAAVGFAVASAASGEPWAIPSSRALIALGYLVVVGSAIGFVAYLVASERLPLQLVMTHAQVNPLVAVILGAIFLGESLSPATALAAALIVASIPLSREL